MNLNDFRYMSHGKQVADLKKSDLLLLKPIDQRSTKTERVLLLLHGFTSTPAVFRYLIPQLKNYDALICPVLPGHAESIQAFTHIKANDWVLYTMQVCKDLFKEYTKVDVLGLSLGGLLTCKLSQHFSFNHMFLLAPALKLPMNITRNLKLLRILKYLGFCELRGMAGNILGNYHELSYRKLPITTLMEVLTLIQEHQWVAPTCPIDLFLGAQDSVVSSKDVEELFSQQPNTNIHWLNNSAHVLPLDNDLEQIIQCINEKST